jgi:hypothetical protein
MAAFQKISQNHSAPGQRVLSGAEEFYARTDGTPIAGGNITAKEN